MEESQELLSQLFVLEARQPKELQFQMSPKISKLGECALILENVSSKFKKQKTKNVKTKKKMAIILELKYNKYL